mmetsp:Transcript_12414/g.39990  ORF Transcript_12414/g.39990 Transcript_12414/m.39990 type:complete len:103 (-) Transcript_12414:484-792(-)
MPHLTLALLGPDGAAALPRDPRGSASSSQRSSQRSSPRVSPRLRAHASSPLSTQPPPLPDPIPSTARSAYGPDGHTAHAAARQHAPPRGSSLRPHEDHPPSR